MSLTYNSTEARPQKAGLQIRFAAPTHFMTRRFDRTDKGGKIHMLSLGAMAHFDYKEPRAYSYEQALQTIRRLDLPMRAH